MIVFSYPVPSEADSLKLNAVFALQSLIYLVIGVVLIGSVVAFLPAEGSRHMSWNVRRNPKPAASTGLSRGFHFDRMGGGWRFQSYICYFQTRSNLYTFWLERDTDP